MTAKQMSGVQAMLQRSARPANQAPFLTAHTEEAVRRYMEDFGQSASQSIPRQNQLNASTARAIATGEQADQWAFWGAGLPWLKMPTPNPAGITRGIQTSSPTSNSAATPEPAIIAKVRLILAQPIAHKLASFLDELASKSGMPVAKTVVSKRVFLSDGRTRIFVRQYIFGSPEDVVEYADASSVEIDAWIDSLPSAERLYFDDDIAVDIYWA